jgi:asparagine N-glycosylation enzyme membrane subunit Stt3
MEDESPERIPEEKKEGNEIEEKTSAPSIERVSEPLKEPVKEEIKIIPSEPIHIKPPTVNGNRVEAPRVNGNRVESSNARDYNEAELMRLRREKISKLFSNQVSWIVGILLFIIASISFRIRTLNIDKLKDITTNDWTLGPDLDPFLFLRWAQEIAENGSLAVIDSMRYVPLGYNTAGEAQLLSYLMVWFYKLLNLLPSFITSMLPGAPTEITVMYAAILFPAFMFVLTIIAFFFLTKEIFKDSFENEIYPNAIGLVAALFLSVLPAILPRTIAGIPEKESAGFFFIFLAFYFIIKSFKGKSYKPTIIHAILAGVSTAGLALIWGGVTFLFMITGGSMFILFMLGGYDKKKFVSSLVWVLTFVPLSMMFSSRYTIVSFLTSVSTAPIFMTLLLSFLGIFIYPRVKDRKFVSYFRERWQFPKELTVLIYGLLILLALIFVFLGPGFIFRQISQVYSGLVSPLTTTRFIRTVAENSQPFFVSNWKGTFGPQIKNIPVFFWMFMFGSVALFYSMFSKIRRKHRVILTATYFIFMIGLIFSRYAPGSTYNGTSSASLMLYFGSGLLFLLYALFVYYTYNRKGEGEKLRVEFPIILVFMMFFVSILAARGGVRFIMVLVPPTSILVAYLIVSNVRNFLDSEKDSVSDSWKMFLLGVVLILVLSGIFSVYSFYEVSKGQAGVFHPSSYNFQWQSAMGWIRENTSQDAVFSHWWDYGYWVQSIGERATVLDGGNAIVYWDHLLGRHVLTAPEDQPGLDFLYTHDTTHLLIDSTDIGKYSAFSSIGSGITYDRFSYIPTFFLNEGQTQEAKEGSLYFYQGSNSLDEDIIFNSNGTEERAIMENSAIGGVLAFQNTDGSFRQPELIVMTPTGQKNILMRYLFFNGELKDFGSGYEGAFYIMQKIDPVAQGISSNDKGAGFYLSKRTASSLLARKYLFGDETNFKLVHTEPHPIVKDLRAQNFEIDDFAYFQGNFIGPIKIWEIDYPADVQKKEEFLVKEFPDAALEKV